MIYSLNAFGPIRGLWYQHSIQVLFQR